MNIRSRREIRQAASHALTSAPGDPRKIAFTYSGIVCLLSLLSTVITYILSHQIADTGGLANMGLRSVLSTINMVLPFASGAVMLGLEVGYAGAMLDIARGRGAEPRTLLQGFHCFGTMLCAAVFQSLICCGVLIAAMYLSSWIFMLLPAYDHFYEIVAPVLESMTVMDSTLTMDDATLAAAAQAMIPMLCIFAVVGVAALIPVSYQYRMVTFCIADDHSLGALAALRESRRMMRRSRFALFRLDLGFWWYYLLQVLVTVICYGDVLLPMVGVTFPWSDSVSYFLFLTVSLALQLVIYGCFMNRATVTYATAYEALRPKPQNKGVVLGNIFDLAKDYEE